MNNNNNNNQNNQEGDELQNMDFQDIGFMIKCGNDQGDSMNMVERNDQENEEGSDKNEDNEDNDDKNEDDEVMDQIMDQSENHKLSHIDNGLGLNNDKLEEFKEEGSVCCLYCIILHLVMSVYFQLEYVHFMLNVRVY